MEICGAIKSYDWGRIGRASKVATLAIENDPQFVGEFMEGTPYAELWMGDHVSGPSTLKETGETLTNFISKDKSVIGDMQQLPFLFKVLSIQKPLSIQIHPNKKQAEDLHAAYPDIYKDQNHKPEIAIALTDFSALCGFRTYDDLYTQLTIHKPLTDLIGIENINELKSNPSEESIKRCYTTLTHSPAIAINECLSKLTELFESQPETDKTVISTIFQHADNHFPNDIGTLSIFFFNILQLKPGDAIYLAANVPHAYLSGDCIECMACSDNVIRAGLTPKFKDVGKLLEMLDFSGSPANHKLFNPVDIGPYTQLFSPPVKDFAVVKVSVPAGVNQYAIENRSYGSIIIILKGSAEAVASGKTLNALKEGSILFLPSSIRNLGLKINSADGFVAYQALYNDF